MIYEKEIKCLEFYTSRKSHRYLDYEEINEFLKFLFNPQNLSNKNMKYIDYTKIKEILESIKNLYYLCCKYGKKHDIPKIIYRQEHHFNNIVKHVDINSKQWRSESFLSFTKSLDEVDRFRFNDNARLIVATISVNDIKNKKIPFIDVTDILGEDEYQKDEQEILIPPFTLIEMPYLDSNMRILSEEYINFESKFSESYEEKLENFLNLYKNCKCDLSQLDNSRKKLGEAFSKKLLKGKIKIMT